MARDAFSHALKTGHCSVAARALDKINADLRARESHMAPNTLRLAQRDLAQKVRKVQACQDKQEASDSSRFNGLLGLGFLGL